MVERRAIGKTCGRAKTFAYLAAAAFAAIIAASLIHAGGVTLSHPYSPNDTHRRQAAAILDGHFWIARSINDVKFDNVYFNGKLQQVWGLGVPIYLIPFELFGRLIGVSPFPDRVSLAVLLGAFFFYAGTLLILLVRRRFGVLRATGIVILITFCPPLVNLLVHGPQNVYEDASVYALITSSAILIATLRFVVGRLSRDYWICCLLGGMSGIVRPTHAVYGVLGPGICFFLLLREQKVRGAIIPMLVVLAGMLFLAVSNECRFGAFAEFGHKLTLTTDDGEMTSRFVNPISRESAIRAARELCGALFFASGDIRKRDMWGKHEFPGQCDCFRWRDFYVTSYDPTVLLLMAAGMASGVWLVRRSKGLGPSGASACQCFREDLPIALLVWGGVSFVLIFQFMMYYPGLSARYLYDFWPGIASLLVLSWLSGSRYRWVAGAILVCWSTFQIYRLDCRNWPLEPGGFADVQVPEFNKGHVARLSTAGFYDSAHLPPSELSQSCDFQRSSAGFEIRLPVDKPRFIELVVGPRKARGSDPRRDDSYRARIGPWELQLVSVKPEGDRQWMHVLFRVPPKIVAGGHDELLFVCFVSRGDRIDQLSQRPIRSVRWR